MPIPYRVGKGMTQGALQVALLVALTINRKIVMRPNVFLCLVSLLAAEALMTALQPQSLRHGIPDLPAGRVRCRAVAADAVVGPPRPAAGPLPPGGTGGGAGLGAARRAGRAGQGARRAGSAA